MIKLEMIKAIYEKVSDKTLSFGCRIENYKSKNQMLIYLDNFGYCNTIDFITGAMYSIEKYKNIIIGHPVMIGDILDYLEKEVLRISKINDEIEIGFSLNKWVEKRKPIEEQSLDCITYIYNLIK